MRWWILPGLLASNRESGSRLNARMNIFVTGLSYKTAPVEVREKLAVRPSLLPCLGCRLKINAGLDEVVLLSTCNRVEVYGTAPWIQGRVHRIFQQLCPADTDVTPYIYVKEGADAVRHLFSVTSGLDSMVIGETEITGQVKLAYQAAQAAKLTGRVLYRVFRRRCRPPRKSAPRPASAAARLPWAVWPWSWRSAFLTGNFRRKP